MVVIGASAGGPVALAAILAGLPVDFPAPIVVVQHIHPHFAAGLADWLNFQTPLRVRLARAGDIPCRGTVLLAGRDQHLVLSGSGCLEYTARPQAGAYRPSVDIFFQSMDRFWPGNIIGVLLTGMGRDGAEGLRALRQSGHRTLAQDEATSAVFGMPKAAADLRAAAEILALEWIGPRLQHLVARRIESHV